MILDAILTGKFPKYMGDTEVDTGISERIQMINMKKKKTLYPNISYSSHRKSKTKKKILEESRERNTLQSSSVNINYIRFPFRNHASENKVKIESVE